VFTASTFGSNPIHSTRYRFLRASHAAGKLGARPLLLPATLRGERFKRRKGVGWLIPPEVKKAALQVSWNQSAARGFSVTLRGSRNARWRTAVWMRSARCRADSLLYLRGRPPFRRRCSRVATASTPSLHDTLHHSPGSPQCVQQTAPSNCPQRSQAAVIQMPRSRKSLWLCSLVSFIRLVFSVPFAHVPHVAFDQRVPITAEELLAASVRATADTKLTRPVVRRVSLSGSGFLPRVAIGPSHPDGSRSPTLGRLLSCDRGQRRKFSTVADFVAAVHADAHIQPHPAQHR
jgi:hypothetical protein